MQVKHDQGTTVVRFSATEVAEAGLPPKPASVTYCNGFYVNNSVWLDKQIGYEPGIDRLIALADTVVYH